MSDTPNPAEFRFKPALFRAMLMAGLALGSARATTYSITNTTMAVAKDGVCGFMEALAANNLKTAMNECPAPVGATTINLSPGTYTPPWGIEVWASVTVRCPSGICAIDAGSLNEDLFTIDWENNPYVVLYRLTLKQSTGNTNSISGLVALGGTLRLEESAINGFKTVGVSLRAGTGHTILRSTLSGNGYGLSLWDNAGLVSQSNTISNNWMGVQTGDAAFTDYGSVISNNTDAGVWVGRFADVLWERTTIRGNRNRGAYFDQYCEAKLYYCTIERNTTSSNGAGIFVAASSGANPNGTGAHVTVTSSTISNNKAAGNGGGAYVNGLLTLNNVTLSNDTAARGGGAYYELYTSTSYLDFAKSTVAFNRATVSGGGVVSITSGPNFHTAGCIIAQNSAPLHPDVSGNVTSRETLFGNVTGFTGTHDRDPAPANPLLGPLMDNAGPNRVLTHALLKGSPAIDKGTELTSIIDDARGFPRPASGTWDLGAYEVGPLETELLTVVSSSGWHARQDDNGLSNRAGTVMRSGAVGNYVTYAVAVPAGVSTGTPYTIQVQAKTSADGAKVELATSPGTTQFTAIGELDLYTSTTKLTRFNRTFSFTSPGIKHFRFRITGKNASSSGYFCFFDYIRIDQQ